MDSSNSDSILDLLIVGAGPVGLTAALEAKRLGLSVRIIERKQERTKHDSRAIVVHPRVLELLESIRGGAVVSEIEKTAFHFAGMFAYVPNWLEWLPGCGLSGNATTSESESKSKHENKTDTNDAPVHLDLTTVDWGDTKYPNLYFLPQYDTERILEETLVFEGGKVEYGIALEGLEQENGVVTTTVKNEYTDATETLKSRWVLGADGGRSKTRESIGSNLHRHTSDIYFVVADIVFKDDNLPLSSHGPGKGGHVFPSVPLGFLPLPGENTYRIFGKAPPGVTSKDDVEMNEQWFRHYLLEHTGRKFENIELGDWRTIFKITHGATDSYRKGNVMIAGDAAHVHSPIGGQGMNLGMQDAINLLWKLAWSKRILRGSSSEEEYAKAQKLVDDIILETYHTERHSLGQDLVNTVEMGTKMMSIDNSFIRFVRSEIIRLLLPSDAFKTNCRKMGQLELAYAPSSSSLIFENQSWTAYYVCSPGQRLPNIRLEDDSQLYSHIDRVRYTWVFLNLDDSEEVHSSLSEAIVVRANAADFEHQVSVPAISEKAYAAPQMLLVRPDQFVAGVGSGAEDLLEKLQNTGLTETALATM